MFILNANKALFARGSPEVLSAQASSQLTFRENTLKMCSNEDAWWADATRFEPRFTLCIDF